MQNIDYFIDDSGHEDILHFPHCSFLSYEVFSAQMDFVTKFGRHEIAFGIELIHELFEFFSFIEHLPKDFAELLDFFDGESFVSVVEYLANPGDQTLGALEFMEQVESLGRHVVDGMSHFLHDPITESHVLAVAVDQFLGLLDALLSDPFDAFIDISATLKFKEEGVYPFLFFEDYADDLLEPAGKQKEIFEFSCHLPKIVVLIIFQAAF